MPDKVHLLYDDAEEVIVSVHRTHDGALAAIREENEINGRSIHDFDIVEFPLSD